MSKHGISINGNTQLIAHIGFPTHSFKSPMIYNPYFASAGINAVVVPMGCQTTFVVRSSPCPTRW
jgi:shikimate dehydrogenase